MDSHHHAHATFHLTGRLAEGLLEPVGGQHLVPAVLAPLRDLDSLRYDYPLLLVDGGVDDYVRPLSAVLDDLLASFAADADEDRIRHHVLRLEAGIRRLVGEGVRLTLADAWETVAKELASGDDSVAESLNRALERLTVTGMLIGCDAAAATDVLQHAWRTSFARHAEQFTSTAETLLVRLNDILAADFQNTPASKSADSLRGSFGSGPMDDFDFDAMSRLLSHPAVDLTIPQSRRDRISRIIETLQSQHFYSDPSTTDPQAYSFVYDTCAAALQAYRDRLPSMIDVAKAIAIGRLEVDGDYVEAKHDPVFDAFGENGLDASDLALFPDYLIIQRTGSLTPDEHDQLTMVLSSGLPFTVLVQTDDVIEPSPVGRGCSALALTSHRLTSMAMGLADVFVLQAPASHLAPVRHRLLDALAYQGPSLVSVYSGAGAQAPGVPAYLLAAAALEARVFPLFCYDPSAGREWADRFDIDGNPQLDSDWPQHPLTYEDAQTQAITVDTPFTLADFVACDGRYAQHFALVPGDGATDDLVLVDDTAARSMRGAVDHVPTVYLVDQDDRLHRAVVDHTVLREVRRSREMWAGIRELAGVLNSHALRAVADAEARWQEERAAQLLATAAEIAATSVAEAEPELVVLVEETVLEQPAGRDPDVAYIETPRCSTCNECTTINNRMFAYNDNQQAYIADITAGTYAQLVEAAESCQVSVIHPGKPLDPNEPGLPDLLARAEPFL